MTLRGEEIVLCLGIHPMETRLLALTGVLPSIAGGEEGKIDFYCDRSLDGRPAGGYKEMSSIFAGQ